MTPATPHAILQRRFTFLCNICIVAPISRLLREVYEPQIFALISAGGFLLFPTLWAHHVLRVSLRVAKGQAWGHLCHILLWGTHRVYSEMGLPFPPCPRPHLRR